MTKTAARTEKRKLSTSARPSAWLYVLLAALLFGMMYGRNLSGDVWWHLKTGQWIIERHAFPLNDPFSYTARNPIILHEWGAEVIAWLVYSKISPPALAAMAVLLISGAFVLAFRTALARSRHTLSSFLVIAAGISASAGSSEMRPQVFTYLFLALAVLVLQRYHERGGWIVWLLAPLIFVWVNFHAVFLIGLGLIGLETIVALITPPKWVLDRPRPRLAAAGPLAAVGLVSALLTLINPNGTAPYVYPLHVMSSSGAMHLTAEWTRPDFHSWTGRSLMVLLGIAGAGFISLRGRPQLRDLAYVALFAIASLLSRRNAVIFALSCAGPIAVWLSCAEDRFAAWLSRRRLWSPMRTAAWTILGVLVAVLFFWRVSDAQGKTAFDYMNMSEVFPVAACDFIEASDIPGPMFNDYNYGGYLIWRLWPSHRVFVDSRQEPFLNGAFEEALSAINCTKPDAWKEIFERRRINFAVLNPAAPLASALVERSDWACVYLDEKAVVFVRRTPANAAVIEAAGR